jgi:hypothetical protein
MHPVLDSILRSSGVPGNTVLMPPTKRGIPKWGSALGPGDARVGGVTGVWVWVWVRVSLELVVQSPLIPTPTTL